MTVKAAKDITRAWVAKETPFIQGFMGAFFHGAVNWLSEEEELPPHTDIDVIVVVTTPPPNPLGKFCYNQLLLEVSYISLDELQTPEQVLGTYYLAGSFQRNSIIADVSGKLTPLQQAVAANYADACWIRHRCRNAEERLLQFLQQSTEAQSLHDQVTSWLFARGVLTHILLVAGLQNPTVRKRYVSLKQLLATHNASTLYEQILELSGFAALTPQAVAAHLHSLTAAFDAAAAHIRTPYRFAADISEVGRPIAIDGSEALLQAGLHREAMFWITATWCRCRHVLTQDAPPHIQVQHDAGFRDLLQELRIDSARRRAQSKRALTRILPKVRRTAEMIIHNIT